MIKSLLRLSTGYLVACALPTPAPHTPAGPLNTITSFETIGTIPTPPGYTRAKVSNGSFSEWLRRVHLKKDPRIHLYNGKLKADQSAQFAVMDLPLGNKDLQQCADAIIRLRAEYFYGRHQLESIQFQSTDGVLMSFTKWIRGTRYKLSGKRLISFETPHIRDAGSREDFEKYLETVFSYAGTISLNSSLVALNNPAEIDAGDVFVRAGCPGHAVVVADICVDQRGHKMFMLAQGFMPAQDMHVVKNPLAPDGGPWYEMPMSGSLITPDWTFSPSQLKHWP